MNIFFKTRSNRLSAEEKNKELEYELLNLLQKKFSYYMQLRTGQLKQTHLLKQIRREVARIKFLYENQK